MKLITCEFNMDSGCVELRFDDGTELDIDCTVVESEYAHTVQQKTELDWLVYNHKRKTRRTTRCLLSISINPISRMKS